MKMKKILALLLASAMVLSMAACGKKEKPDDSKSAAPSGSTSTEDKSSDEPAKPVKDTLVIGHYGDTPNFDTHNNLNDCGMRINLSVYDPLVRMDNTTYEIKPCVAESWEISDDGTEYTFAIKPGIKFSDGTDLTVDDVVFSLERGIKMPMAVPSFGRVQGVEKVDDSHVKVKLDGPYNEFLFAMALPTAGILSKAAFESMGEEKFAERPVTTGPYYVSDWKVGEKVVLKANEHYHMGEVPIKNVEYRVISDANSAVLNLESGDIDAYVDVPQTSYKRISENENLELHKGEAFAYRFIQLNCDRPPFNNPDARKAMAYATDKEAMLYGIMDGDGTIIDTFCTPEYVGYTDDVTKYPYDLDKAKELFTKAGVTEDTPIEIVLYDPITSKFAQVIQDSLHQIGITTNINQMERSAFDDACLGGDFDLICAGGTFTAPSIDDSIYTCIHSSMNEVRNYGHYNSERADELLDTARVTMDEGERAKLYNELMKLLSDDVPLIPTLWRTKNIACNKDLKGVTSNPWSFYNLYEMSWG